MKKEVSSKAAVIIVAALLVAVGVVYGLSTRGNKARLTVQQIHQISAPDRGPGVGDAQAGDAPGGTGGRGGVAPPPGGGGVAPPPGGGGVAPPPGGGGVAPPP
jgi:hypothetical protein